MKYLSLVITICLMSAMSACQQSGVSIDPAQQRAQIDSIVGANVKVIQDSINMACSQRMAQEVPAKADSIVKAQKAAATTPITTPSSAAPGAAAAPKTTPAAGGK